MIKKLVWQASIREPMVRLVPRISSAKLQIMVSWIKSFIKGTYPFYSHPSLPSSLRDPDSPPCLPCVYKVRSTGRGANLRQTASNNTAFPRAPRPATLSGHIVWPFPPRLPSSGLGTLVHFFPVFSTPETVRAPRGLSQPPPHLETLDSEIVGCQQGAPLQPQGRPP